MIRIAVIGAAALFACVAAMPAIAAEGTREIHGSADAFAMPGLALAWAILRAPKEDDTAVVLRIEADPLAYGWIEIVGKDPFSQREERLQAMTGVGGPFDLKVARGRFADFPRTEIRLWRVGPAATGAPFVVYYLGVPDTTPEIAQPQDLDRSLSARIARVRDSTRTSP
jgi:hypothetical protein